MNKEAALIVNFVTSLLSALVVFRVLDTEQATALEATALAAIPMITVLGGVVIRQFVFSRHTIQQAGLDPKAVVERARDPMVVPHKESGGRL